VTVNASFTASFPNRQPRWVASDDVERTVRPLRAALRDVRGSGAVRMRVLVTNDDGVESPGIMALAGVLHDAGHDVIVVAPTSERSGSSAAIGPLHRNTSIPVVEHSWETPSGVAVLAIDAPPATAVYAACLGGFGPVPDLVASGVNPGANTGHLVLHSGTVGAALTAAGLGVPGLAVSVRSPAGWDTSESDEYQFETAARFALAAVPWVATPSTPPRVLNLNAPNRPFDEVLGVREATLAPYGTVWAASADHEGGELLLDFKGNDTVPDPDTDLAALTDGYCSVTPLPVLERAPFDGVAEALLGELGVARSSNRGITP
jgi:5'-nucleotidase